MGKDRSLGSTSRQEDCDLQQATQVRDSHFLFLVWIFSKDSTNIADFSKTSGFEKLMGPGQERERGKHINSQSMIYGIIPGGLWLVPLQPRRYWVGCKMLWKNTNFLASPIDGILDMIRVFKTNSGFELLLYHLPAVWLGGALLKPSEPHFLICKTEKIIFLMGLLWGWNR